MSHPSKGSSQKHARKMISKYEYLTQINPQGIAIKITMSCNCAHTKVAKIKCIENTGC